MIRWVVLVFVTSCFADLLPIENNANYTWYCTGNCNTPTIPPSTSQFGRVLMGGGSDVDAAYAWMCEKAGGGDWVVIRTTGDGAYNPYIYDICQGTNSPFNSVSTFVLKNRNSAFDDFVVGRTKNASALWFAGGDQWTYYNYWKGSPLNDVISTAFLSRPMGGTSAGNAVQPQMVYTAEFGSAVSPESLRNPYNQYITFGTSFIKDTYFQNMITDTHFAQRDRMGRLVTFVSRIAQDSWASLPPPNSSLYGNCANMRYGARGIGVDEATALLIDSDYTMSITSWDTDGSAYLLCLDHTPTLCTQNEDLEVNDITVVRLSGNNTNVFDLQSWSVLTDKNIAQYTLSASKGKLTSTQQGGNIY